MRFLTAIAALLPGPLAAETPLGSAAFQDHVGQNTVLYQYSDGTRGIADYGPDRTLRWAFEGDICIDGKWFQKGDDLCFAFTDGRISACWQFTLDDNRLHGIATWTGSDDPAKPPLEIREVSHTDQPLTCPAPQVGS